MPNGKPGDSVHHDIVHLKLPVFGPVCDDLVRQVSARIPLSHLGELQKLIEPWPWTPEGTPRDLDLLERHLRDLLERANALPPDPPPPPIPEPDPPPSPPQPATPPRRSGGARLLRGLLGFVLGAVLCGLGAFILSELLIPMPAGDAAMGTAIMILLVITPGAALLGGIIGAVLMARR